MTDGEWKLWNELRGFRKLYGLHIRRQAPIGPYIADFAIFSRNLIIELDGEFHFTEDGASRDQNRDEWFRQQGFRILRITTAEFSENPTGCINSILFELGLLR